MSYCSPPRRPSDFHELLAMGSNQWAHGVVVSHPLSMREALGSILSVSMSMSIFVPISICISISTPFRSTAPAHDHAGSPRPGQLGRARALLHGVLEKSAGCTRFSPTSLPEVLACSMWPSDLCLSRAHGVVVSHPLSMREALGSIPSVSMSGCLLRCLIC